VVAVAQAESVFADGWHERALDRVITATGVSRSDDVMEHEAVPVMLAAAHALVEGGDIEVMLLLRGWLFDGATQAAEQYFGDRFGLGENEYEGSYDRHMKHSNTAWAEWVNVPINEFARRYGR